MKPEEEEMKLTVVRFQGRLRIVDKKGIFQQAVYEEAVRAFYIPTENLGEPVEEHAVPPRSIFLRCRDTMTVSSYKGKDGVENEQRMEAVGEARVRDDTYIGDGHTISYDGAVVILKGYNKDDQATLRRRERTAEGQDHHSGREIRYDTRTGRVDSIDSNGGKLTTYK
jgi:hypothetical protein